MNHQLKPLYLIEGNGGGAIIHALTLAKLLDPDMFSPSVAFFLDGTSVSLAEEWGVHYRLIPWRFASDLTLAWRLSRMIQEEKIDILHTHTITGNFYARWAASLSSHRPTLLTTVHSFVIDEMKGNTKITIRDWLRYKRDMYGQRLTRHFIAVSEKIKKRMVENGIPAKKITVIENGVDVPCQAICASYRVAARSELGLAPDETAIGMAGRLVPLKNHDFFLQIAQKVASRMERVRFIIIGDGVLRSELEETAQRLGIQKKVIFTGWRNDVLRLLSALDIYVLCSLTEGMNISILEAMSCAKPVVGSRIEGIADIVRDRKTGLLFSCNDLDGFVSGLTELIRDKAWATQLGRDGRELVKKSFSDETMLKKTALLYLELTSCRDYGKIANTLKV